MRKLALLLSLVLLCTMLCACQEKTAQIYAYLDDDLSLAEQRAVVTKVCAIDHVLEVQHVTAEEALETFKAQHEDEASFDAIDVTYFSDRIIVTVEADAADLVAEELEQLDGVAYIQIMQVPAKSDQFFAWIQEQLQ